MKNIRKKDVNINLKQVMNTIKCILYIISILNNYKKWGNSNSE